MPDKSFLGTSTRVASLRATNRTCPRHALGSKTCGVFVQTEMYYTFAIKMGQCAFATGSCYNIGQIEPLRC